MFGAVTPEGITADLEAMHRVGLGGAYPVSYTHLDVYKRQVWNLVSSISPAG